METVTCKAPEKWWNNAGCKAGNVCSIAPGECQFQEGYDEIQKQKAARKKLR